MNATKPPPSERTPLKWEIYLVQGIGYFSFLTCLACSGIEIYRAVHAIKKWKSFHAIYSPYTIDKSEPFFNAGFVPDTDQPLDQAVGGPWKALQGAYVFNPTFHIICALVLFPVAMSELPNSKLWHHTLRRGSCLQFLGRPNTTFHMGLLQTFIGASSWGRRPTDNWSLFPTAYMLMASGALNIIFTPLYRDAIWTMRKQYEPEKPAPKTEKKDDEPPKPIQKYDAYVKYMERKKDIIDQGRHSRLKNSWENFKNVVLKPGTTNSATGEIVIQINSNHAFKALKDINEQVANITKLIDHVSAQGFTGKEDGMSLKKSDFFYTLKEYRKEHGDTGPLRPVLSNGAVYQGQSNYGAGGGVPGGGGIPYTVPTPVARVAPPVVSQSQKKKI